jgi:(S)-ureidoglycine aminohydrolase
MPRLRRAAAIALLALLARAGAAPPPACAAAPPPPPPPPPPDWGAALAPARAAAFADLPGFTRSFHRGSHALLAPESRVFSANPLWRNATTAHLVAPSAATGAHFSMLLADLAPGGGTGAPPPPGVERFALVLAGVVSLRAAGRAPAELAPGGFAYLPPGLAHSFDSPSGARLLLFERRFALGRAARPRPVIGDVEAVPAAVPAGEMFALRRLLPPTPDHDFNIHVMDFLPGEYLNVKESHYNQHGLLMVAGQGIYRLGEEWFPVAAGDALYLGPFAVQWYCALGPGPTRYVLYKDTGPDPLAAL